MGQKDLGEQIGNVSSTPTADVLGVGMNVYLVPIADVTPTEAFARAAPTPTEVHIASPGDARISLAQPSCLGLFECARDLVSERFNQERNHSARLGFHEDLNRHAGHQLQTFESR